MRKLIVIFCFSFIALSAYASSISGIRIESEGSDVVVFLDGKQVCTPTASCFIAHLQSGHYQIEVYESAGSHRRGPARKGKLLYKERFYYQSSTTKDISVRVSTSHHAVRDRTMSPDTFSEFIRSLKEKGFDDDRNKLVEAALLTSDFTSGQCLDMVKLFTFGNEKVRLLEMVYPRITDKQNFFMVVETLTFKTDRDRVNEFIKEYHLSTLSL